MQLKIGESYEGFRLIEEKEIKEIEGYGRHWLHEATGLTLLSLSNQDPHKVFSINFQTLPEDNSGVAHIVEHTVCCASENYPLKETFMAMGQGSICTTMNACTYPDRTMYYAASPSEKDLLGLMKVYIDLVFHPKMLKESQYFLQEGWHYVLEDVESPLELSGVVYHEMLGEYGEASSYLQRYELETLFPETCYQYDAGGLPEEIVHLTEKQFLDFYKKHYTGNNATITLYGDMDVKAFLKQLNREDLKHITKGVGKQTIVKQSTFDKPRYTLAYYPTSLQQAPTLASLRFVVGGATDPQERIALEILEHCLLRSTASPLLRTLIMEEKLGMSLSDGGYDSCRQQPTFAITLKGTTKEKAIAFEDLTLDVLTKIVEEGMEQQLVDAAIETLEFELVETDASYEPIGIAYSEMMLSGLYYGGDLFKQLSYQEVLAQIKSVKNKGYFEDLIKRYFLDNNHRALVIVLPDEKMQVQQNNHQMQELAAYKDTLDEPACLSLIQLNEDLEATQLEENSEDLLSTLPQLTLADLPEQLPTLTLEEDSILNSPIQWHIAQTKQIMYLHFLWDATAISKAQLPILGLLAHLFTYMGTTHLSYAQVENAINTYTGSMSVAVHAHRNRRLAEENVLLPIFKVSCKLLPHHVEQAMDLLTELFVETQFTEKEKLREQLGQIFYEIERSFTGAPEYRATQRLYTYLSPEGVYEDQISGLGFYQYIKAIYEDFDGQYEKLAADLKDVLSQLIYTEQLKMSVSVSKSQQELLRVHLKNLIQNLPHSLDVVQIQPLTQQEQPLILGDEAFFNGQEVQAIAKGICYSALGYHYKGQLEVIANVLENTYLWDRVRLQGGAYGCDIMLTREGYVSICSYCDPQLQQTLKVYGEIGNYLRQLQLSEATIERAIISTLGAMLAPISMEQQSERACHYWITGEDQSLRQRIYDEIRQTTLADFHAAAPLFESLAVSGKTCIFGSKEKLLKQKSHLRLIDLNI